MLKALLNWLPSARPALAFDSALFSRIGGRDNLEDAAAFRLSRNASGCWVVADGVGGQGAGEVAAQLAVDTLLQGIGDLPICEPQVLQSLLASAHQTIAAARHPDSVGADMASTVVALISDGKTALWGHVGDSRLYHFRAGKIWDRTEDQSLVNMLLARGVLQAEEVDQFPQRHIILHALGQDKAPEFCTGQPVALKSGDGFLLCSDGVWELLNDAELLDCWRNSMSAQEWLDNIERLIQPRAIGDADNYTAVAVRVLAVGK